MINLHHRYLSTWELLLKCVFFFYSVLSILKMKSCLSNKIWVMSHVDESVMSVQGVGRYKGINLVQHIGSLCVRLRSWSGYLASISRAALGACWGGANDRASRAGQGPCRPQLLVNMPAEKTRVHGEVCYNTAVLLVNILCPRVLTHAGFQHDIMRLAVVR